MHSKHGDEARTRRPRRRRIGGLVAVVPLLVAGSLWLRGAAEPDLPLGYITRLADWDRHLDARFGPLPERQNQAGRVVDAVLALGRLDEDAGTPTLSWSGGTPPSVVRAHLAAAAERVEDLRVALAAGRCRFGPRDEVPILYWHRAGEILLARGRCARADGRWTDARRALHDLGRLDASLAEYPTLVGVMVRSLVVRAASSLARELATAAGADPTELRVLRDLLPRVDLARECVHAMAAELAFGRAVAEGHVHAEELPWLLDVACTLGLVEGLLGEAYGQWEHMVGDAAREGARPSDLLRGLEDWRGGRYVPPYLDFMAPPDLYDSARVVLGIDRALAVTRAGLRLLEARSATGALPSGVDATDPLTGEALTLRADGAALVLEAPDLGRGDRASQAVARGDWILPGS